MKLKIKDLTVEAELARLRAGVVTNRYGDLVSHSYGYTITTRSRYAGIKFAVLDGFYRRRYPRKHTVWLTSSLLNVLAARDVIAGKERDTEIKRERVEKARRNAKRAGFASFAAQLRHEATVSGLELRIHEIENELNPFGLARRDEIRGDLLVLRSVNGRSEHRVSLTEFLQLFNVEPTPERRRRLGWTLQPYDDSQGYYNRFQPPTITSGRKLLPLGERSVIVEGEVRHEI